MKIYITHKEDSVYEIRVFGKLSAGLQAIVDKNKSTKAMKWTKICDEDGKEDWIITANFPKDAKDEYGNNPIQAFIKQALAENVDISYREDEEAYTKDFMQKVFSPAESKIDPTLQKSMKRVFQYSDITTQRLCEGILALRASVEKRIVSAVVEEIIMESGIDADTDPVIRHLITGLYTGDISVANGLIIYLDLIGRNFDSVIRLDMNSMKQLIMLASRLENTASGVCTDIKQPLISLAEQHLTAIQNSSANRVGISKAKDAVSALKSKSPKAIKAVYDSIRDNMELVVTQASTYLLIRQLLVARADKLPNTDTDRYELIQLIRQSAQVIDLSKVDDWQLYKVEKMISEGVVNEE